VHFLDAQAAHETAGAARTRSSLRPLNERRAKKTQSSGSSCRESAVSYSVVIPAKAGIQYSRSAVIEPRSRDVLDPCLCGDDSGMCGAISASLQAKKHPSLSILR
jgi:hypothetical protein